MAANEAEEALKGGMRKTIPREEPNEDEPRRLPSRRSEINTHGNDGEYPWGDIDFRRPVVFFTMRGKSMMANLLIAAKAITSRGPLGTVPPPFSIDSRKEIWPFLVYPAIPQWFVLPLMSGTDYPPCQ